MAKMNYFSIQNIKLIFLKAKESTEN